VNELNKQLSPGSTDEEIFNSKSYQENSIHEYCFNNTSTAHLKEGFIMALLMEHINISYI